MKQPSDMTRADSWPPAPVKLSQGTEAPVQSADIGSSRTVRKKKSKNVQSIKKEMKDTLSKMDKGLRY